MKNPCIATIKLTEEEIRKIIFCIKSVHNMLGVFEIKPEEKWKMSLNGILKDMENVSKKIEEAKREMISDKKKEPNPKKEYINKITGEESIEDDKESTTKKGI